MRFVSLALLAGLALASAACSQGPADEVVDGEDELREGAAASTASVVKGNTAFAVDLYKELKGGDDNVFFSPYSISTALAMTSAGARGATATAMREGLRLPSGNVHGAFKSIAADLASRSRAATRGGEPFSLNIANSLWGERTQPFASAFVSTVNANYGAGLELADFLHRADAERGRINRWVEDKTNDKIKDLLAQGTLTPETRLVLVNAIYFKAGWEKVFQADDTERQPFKPLAGGTANVDMMGQTSSMKHGATADYEAVALPYAGGEVEFVAIAPKVGTFRSFESSLTGEKLDRIYGSLESKRVSLSLPKFKIAGDSIALKDQLKKLGMQNPFSDNADFRGITGRPETKIGDVIHKAFIALDEKGTEAAAATAVIMVMRSARPQPPVEARFDRPFIFAIRDVPTGSVLFLGRVAKP